MILEGLSRKTDYLHRGRERSERRGRTTLADEVLRRLTVSGLECHWHDVAQGQDKAKLDCSVDYPMAGLLIVGLMRP